MTGRSPLPASRRAAPGPLVVFPFVITICLAGFLFAYLAYRFACAGMRAGEEPSAGWISTVVPWLLATVTALAGLRWVTLLVLSFFSFCRERRRTQRWPIEWPLVSIFVPAYNESENIEAALESLLHLDYPRYEVIVVDDGSTDDTYARARRFAGQRDRCAIRVHRKANGGKWTAHNYAFRRSVGELVLCLDADSRVEPSSLRRMVVHMADPPIRVVPHRQEPEPRTAAGDDTPPLLLAAARPRPGAKLIRPVSARPRRGCSTPGLRRPGPRLSRGSLV